MEYRCIESMSRHIDHAENLERYDFPKMKEEDRHINLVPYKHNRVKLDFPLVQSEFKKFKQVSLIS